MNLKKLSGGVDTLFGSGGKSSNSAESLTKQNPEMSGYMVKQGGLVKSWNRRYFILKDNQLHYYKDRTDKEPLDSIVLDDATVQTARVAGKPNCIEVNCAQRCYFFSPDTEKKRDQWIAALQKAASLTRQQGASVQRPSPDGLKKSILPKSVTKQPESPKTTASGRKLIGSLTLERLANQQIDKNLIPKFVHHVVFWLKQYALTTKGLFKLAGVSYEVSALRAEVDEKGDAKLDHYSPHSIATLLKMFLQELPERIVTFELFYRFTDITGSSSQERLPQIKEVVAELPEANKAMLRFLAAFLNLLSQHAAENQMTIQILSIIFAPIIFPPVDIPAHMPVLCANTRAIIECPEDI